MAPGVTCRLISPSTPHSVTYSPWLPSKTEQMLPTRSVSLCSSQRASSSCHCFRPKFQPHPRPKSSSLLAKCSAVSAEQSLLTSTVQEVSTAPLVAGEKIGVLLLNLGGPETLEDVQPFLFNLFADPDIIRLPRLFRFLQKPLAQFISVARAPKSKEGYASIGGGSPLRRITDAQVLLSDCEMTLKPEGDSCGSNKSKLSAKDLKLVKVRRRDMREVLIS